MGFTPDRDDGRASRAGSEPVGERVRIFRRGPTWYANFQEGHTQRRPSLRTTSKKEARRRALKIEAELSTGQWKPAPEVVSVEGAIKAYLDYLRAEERSAKTMTKYAKVFERVTDLAELRRVKDLSGIDLRFMDAYRSIRTAENAAAKTRYTESVVVRQLINFAMSRDMIGIDPMKGLKLKKPKPTPQPCWTLAEVSAILAASPIALKPLLTLLAETGMRFGEAAWLTWEDIDLTANILRIQPKEGWKPKSGDQRAVPISPAAAGALVALPRRWQWVVTMPGSKQRPGPGRQWTERRALSALKEVLKVLGLAGKLHTFRHSFISNALLQGTPVAVVRDWVGHVDDEIIKQYTHVHSDASQTAMRRLAKANQASGDVQDDQKSMETDSAQIQHNGKEHRHDGAAN